MITKKSPLFFNDADYLNNPDKYVYPFVIHEKSKDRTIITYNQGQFGNGLRAFHEKSLEWFNENIADRNKYSYAYHKGVRCADALKEHLKSNFFIKLDIHKFFESITEELFFERYGDYFNKKITRMIQCCFYKGSLSIGFVTSPAISDYFLKGFDKKIGEYVKAHPETHYSRYSDDILLSSEETDDDKSLNDLFELVKEELKALKLEINPKKLFKTKLSYQEHNSISYLGLAISKLDDIDNKVTISKRYILFLLSLIKKNKKYGSKCKGLLDEINSRVAYLAYNSPVSYARFQKKHLNTFGEEYKFTPRKPLDRVQPIVSNELPDFNAYAQVFEFELHDKVSNTQKYGFTKLDAITIKKYIGKDEVVRIPKFVDVIGEQAFCNSYIKEVIFEGNIKQISNSAFEHCSKLEKINLPKSLRYIGTNAFAECKSLKEIVIPEKVKVINPGAFWSSSLEKVVLPEGLKEIRFNAFAYTPLKEINIPQSLEVLSYSVFHRCERLESIVLNEGLLKIDTGAFESCIRLKNVSLPESLLEIELDAFNGCVRLEQIVIPDNVVSIHEGVFDGCTLLKNIILNNNRVFALNKNGDLIEKATGEIVSYRSKVIDGNTKTIPNKAFAGEQIETLVIPEGVEHIGIQAFSGCYLLKEVSLPSTLKSIGASAFSDCVSLKEIVIPNGVKVIKNNAFAGCKKLEKVVLPEGLTKISENAFEDDQLLKDINIPKSVTAIDKHAFKYCYGIKDLFISESVKKIHKKAFYGCSYSLDTIKVSPMNMAFTSGENTNTLVIRKTGELILGCKNSFISKDVNIIYNHAFVNCLGLKKVALPKTVTVIQKGAFKGCLDLEKVDLGNVYTIGAEAFKGDAKITKIDLPESLTKLEDGAFLETNIKELRIPTSLGDYALSSKTFNLACVEELHISSAMKNIKSSDDLRLPNLKKVTVDKNNSAYRDDGQNVIKNDDGDIVLGSSNAVIKEGEYHILQEAFAGLNGLKSLVIPEQVVLGSSCFAHCCDLKTVVIKSNSNIPNGAFKGCEKLEKVIIEKGVERIGTEAFNGCSSLKEASLPSSLKVIGLNAFYGCSSLKEIIIPKGIESIEIRAFMKCDKLEKIVLPQGLKNISNYLFSGCKKLSSIVLPKGLKNIGNRAFEGCISLKEIEIPNGVTSLDGAFYNCKSLKKVKLGDNVTSIGPSTFAYCEALKEITLPKKLEVIGSQAFEKCESLEKVVMFNKVANLESHAFKNCKSLKEIALSNKLKSIDPETFFGCKSLKEIILPASVERLDIRAFAECKALKGIVLPNKLNCISNSVFENSGLESIVINDNLSSLGNNAFYRCQKLKRVEFSAKSNLEYISNEAFMGCSNLSEVILPKKLKRIYSHAFAECPNLKEIKLPETLEEIGAGVFAFDSKIKEIYIPRALTIFNSSAYYGCNTNKVTVNKSNKYFESINNALVVKKEKKSKVPALLTSASNNSVIPEKVSIILPSAFAGENKSEELTIPNNVTIIGREAFIGWSNLKKINFVGNNLREIDPLAFMNSPLDDVKLPDSVTYLGSSAFGKVKVKEININEKVESLSPAAFDSRELEKINVDKNNPYYASLDSNILVDKIRNQVLLVASNFKVPEGIEEIKDINITTPIKELVIPQSLETVGVTALDDADIKKFVINNNPYFATNADGSALINKTNMSLLYYKKDGILPEGIRSVKSGVTLSKDAKKLYIPSSLKDLSTVLCYFDLSNIEEIEVSKDNPYFDSRDNCNAIIGSKSDILLLACKNTKIPESVHTIGSGAYVTSGIDRIFIPKHVKYININAFNRQTKYVSIEVDKDNPFFEVEKERDLIINKKHSYKPGALLIRFRLASDIDEEKEKELRRVSGFTYDCLTDEERKALKAKPQSSGAQKSKRTDTPKKPQPVIDFDDDMPF